MSIYTIDPLYPFARTLAQYVLENTPHLPDLSDDIILLPTRRACRVMQQTLLDVSKQPALLLPRLIPMGDVDDDEINFSEAEIHIPKPISLLQRQTMMTQLIMAKPAQYGLSSPSPEQAYELAQSLGHLMDQVETEMLSFDQLKNLVPDQYALHWQDTLKFLELITHHLPQILAEENKMNPAAHRVQLLLAQAKIWTDAPPQGRLIAAGSTGSLPATAHLLEVISQMEKGTVVLPGLDKEMDADSWKAVTETHAQYGFKKLLEKMKIDRQDIQDLPLQSPAFFQSQAPRKNLMTQALQPAETTEQWHHLPPLPQSCLENLRRFDCASQQEEALVIALLMRENLEHPNRKAILITPDRLLAQRVSAELKRWNVFVDDSAGKPLHQTSLGTFLLLSAQMVIDEFAPYPLLATLKHALCKFEPSLITELELTLLRGPRPEKGIDGLIGRLKSKKEKSPKLLAFLMELKTITAPFTTLCSHPTSSFQKMIQSHLHLMEQLGHPLGQQEWAEECQEFLQDVLTENVDLDHLPPSSYPALLESMMATKTVRQPLSPHQQLMILGPMEARMVEADLVILGSLNEGTFPAETQPDPWMSRPMRKEFGLPGFERKIGLTSHDFMQAFCAPHVVLTRSEKVDGTPTVPSRWLQRLDAVLQKSNLTWPADDRWLYSARHMDLPDQIKSIAPPAPTPPLAARPKKLSVTDVERWMRDPYSIYAKHILKLKPLDPIDKEIEPSDFGTLVHKALEEFVTQKKQSLEDLMTLFQTHLADQLPLHVLAFWQPRLQRIAQWFIQKEKELRPRIDRSYTEIRGELKIDDHFTLTGTADRIDLMKDGTLSIIDYKTGRLPTNKEFNAGYSPQLPLEALMAQKGAFPNIPDHPVTELSYWKLGKGKDNTDGGEETKYDENLQELIAETHVRLKALIMAFENPKTPYHARPVPSLAPEYSDYEHLARTQEWGDESGEE